MSFSGLYTNSELIMTNCEAKTNEEVIKLLVNIAMKQGFVEDIFLEKILERERAFPTGLPIKIPIAIPHIHEGCLKSFLAVAVMKEPVKFDSMDGSNEPIMAKMIFLFGITDPSQQTQVLSKFCDLFQDEDLIKELIAINESNELLRKLKDALGDLLLTETETI